MDRRSGQGAPLSSIVLLRRAKAGDSQALEDFCLRYLPVLRRWARGRLSEALRTQVDTDDLVQQTLLETVRNLDRFEPGVTPGLHAFLRRALENRIRDEARRRNRRPAGAAVVADIADLAPSPLEAVLGREALERYERALARLRVEDRDAIVARIELGLPYDELAGMLGKPTANAARMAVSRAILRLAEEVAGER